MAKMSRMSSKLAKCNMGSGSSFLSSLFILVVYVAIAYVLYRVIMYFMSDIIGFIILGLLAGALAKWITPGKQKSGCLFTVVLGIGGSIVGGFIAKFLSFLPATSDNGLLPSWGSIITATLGAFLLLLIFSKKGKK